MPSCKKSANAITLLLWLVLFWPASSGLAGEFDARIRRAELVEANGSYQVDAQIDYNLSPTAKEALHKGIALSWKVLLEIDRSGSVWDSRIYRYKLPYSLNYHALLNQYAVRSRESIERFLSLQAALNYMSTVRLPITVALPTNGALRFAVKSQFHRESLPIPLRPMAYLDPQWSLSSDWQSWSLTK